MVGLLGLRVVLVSLSPAVAERWLHQRRHSSVGRALGGFLGLVIGDIRATSRHRNTR